MLVTFKSKAAADIIMYETHAQPFFDLLNKDSKRGIITAAECDHASALLSQQIANSKAAEPAKVDPSDIDEQDDDANEKKAALKKHVTFSARFYPLLEMLQAAKKSNADIVWGM